MIREDKNFDKYVHVSLRFLYEADGSRIPSMRVACDFSNAAGCLNENGQFCGDKKNVIYNNNCPENRMPTCPRCAVLLDEVRSNENPYRSY